MAGSVAAAVDVSVFEIKISEADQIASLVSMAALDTRERARRDMPEPLRRDVRLLGDLLGQVLREYGGQGLLDDTEELRHAVIGVRTSERDPQSVVALVNSWTLERAEEVARAFTVYFHLANLAEERHRVRLLRARGAVSTNPADSLAGAAAELRRLRGDAHLAASLAQLELHPVLTAHPTEARRRAVVTAIGRVGEQLDRVDDPRAGDAEQADAHRRLLEEIDILWRTAHLRSTSIDPLDEVRTAMAVFDKTLFRLVPSALPHARTGADRQATRRRDRRSRRSCASAAGSAATVTGTRT